MEPLVGAQIVIPGEYSSGNDTDQTKYDDQSNQDEHESMFHSVHQATGSDVSMSPARIPTIGGSIILTAPSAVATTDAESSVDTICPGV